MGALALVSCGSDPVSDEPNMVGVATVRSLQGAPDAAIDEPEVSGPRTVRFQYETEACGRRDADAPLPDSVRATYTSTSVALVVTQVPPDCAEDDRVQVTRSLEVFLVEQVGERTVSGSLAGS